MCIFGKALDQTELFRLAGRVLNFGLAQNLRDSISCIAMTKLALAISGRNFKEAAEQIEKVIAAGAEIIELRLDYLEQLDKELAEKLTIYTRGCANGAAPLIATCRDKRQGGAIDHPESLRVEALVAAVDAGAEFIDCEYTNFNASANCRESITSALARNSQALLILSEHNFQGSFENLNQIYERLVQASATVIPKIVYTANHINDCFEAFDLLNKIEGRATIFCMGDHGLISRILAKKLGSFVTFAAVDEDTATAPGQLTLDELKRVYRYERLNADTKLFGVIGEPVAHSMSPKIHNACFADIDFDCLYLPLLVAGGKEQFDLFIDNVLNRPWLDFAGFSVTIPHKQNAIDFVREKGGYIDPLTERIGAANTVLIDKQGGLSAYNTDYTGAMEAIEQGLDIGRSDFKGMPVAVVGAGGVARAIVAGLADTAADVKIYNRTVEKARTLAEEFGCEYASLNDLTKMNAELVINCTSIGMSPEIDKSPVPSQCLGEGMAVFDTVYNPAETLLLEQAKQAGAKTINGVSMFINQAAEQFRLFTGQEPDRELMRKIVADTLKGDFSV